MQEISRDWFIRNSHAGKEIIFKPSRSGPTFLVPLIASLLTAVFCLYGIYYIASSWFMGEEVLVGGVVVVAVLIGGLFLSRFWYRHAFRVKRYVLGSSRLELHSDLDGIVAEVIIDKDRVTEVLQLYTPPKENGESGTWRTCVVSGSDLEGKHNELFFEGNSEAVSNWLSTTLSEWAGVSARGENTSD